MLGSFNAPAQESAETLAEPEVAAPQKRSADDGDVFTRPDARAMTLSIPALRGQIVDRFGNPLAQNKVVWYPALQFQQFVAADRAFVVNWARERIDKANEIFGINWEVSDEVLWQHYRHRRWLAMPYTHVVEADRKKELEPKLIDGLVLHPLYQRHYPEGELAAHLIGYVGSKGKLEKGPINYADPIFEYTEGRAGFEKLFDEQLRGKPGLRKLQYDSSGTEVLRELKRAPQQGGTVVTTIDLEWQKRAEKVLADHAERGALIIIDVQTGEIVAMASRPSYNLNTFVPFISNDAYGALRDNPDAPLFSRAFQAEYPPGSTFKAVVALAALKNNVIDEYTQIECPAFIQLGKHQMYNWSRKPEGYMDIVQGIYRSNNPFFIKLGIATRPYNITEMAKMLGYGSRSGLPLVGEKSGLLPDDDYMLKNHRRKMTDGDTANISIGQGVLLATPLQVAQGMAGIANGGKLPKLRLIRQVQDPNGRILSFNNKETRTHLNMRPGDVSLVQEGLMNVVNNPAGTGKRAALSYTVVCGKTGTSQWGPPSKEQYLGWFTGFFPLNKPKYAFAMVYEGRPGEKVSGGSKSGPMVPAFFEPIADEVKFRMNPPGRALIVQEDAIELVVPVAADPVIPGRAIIVAEDDDALPVSPPIPRAILVEEDDNMLPVIPGPNQDLPPVVDPSQGSSGDQPTTPPRGIPVEE